MSRPGAIVIDMDVLDAGAQLDLLEERRALRQRIERFRAPLDDL